MPLAAAARLGFIVRASIRSRLPMPLQLNDVEMNLLLSLAQPIDQRQRDQFLREVTVAIDEEAARTGIGPGPGLVHRVGRVVQRRYFDPPQSPNASKAARA
jgi:hypothetical protein